MCLAVPAKIVDLNGENAVVDIQGVRREAIVTFIADPKIGDYVLLHAGFAIRTAKERWNRASAMRKRRRSKDNALKAYPKLKPTWINGNSVGPTHAFTEPPSGKSR